MTPSVAVLAGAMILSALIFGAAVAISSRFQIATSPEATVRLDRWTGEVALCLPQPMQAPPGKVGLRYVCDLLVNQK